MSPLIYLLFFVAGVGAGIMNTVGGGGSVLTLPLMIFAGIPAAAANATNRIGVIAQNIIAVRQFRRGGVKEDRLALPLTLAGCLGAVIGVYLAAHIPSRQFELILAILMLCLLVLIVLRPKPRLMDAGNNTDFLGEQSAGKRIMIVGTFFLLGIYGGFLQAGIGIMILLALGFFLRLDLVRGNYVKLFFILIVQIVAFGVFLLQDVPIFWLAGLTLLSGQVLGAYIGSWIVLKGGERWILIALVLCILLSSGELLRRYFTYQPQILVPPTALESVMGNSLEEPLRSLPPVIAREQGFGRSGE